MQWDDITRFRNLDGPNGTIRAVMESLRLPSYSSAATDVVCLAVTGRAYDEVRLKQVFEHRLMREKVWLFSPIPRDLRHPNLRITHVPATSDQEFALKVAAHLERHLVAAVRRQVARREVSAIDYAESERFYPPLDCGVRGFRFTPDGRIPFECSVNRQSPFLLVDISSSHKNLADVPMIEHATRNKRFSFVEIQASHHEDAKLSTLEPRGVATDSEFVAKATEMVRDVSTSTMTPARRIVLTGSGSAGRLAVTVGAAIPGTRVVVDNCLVRPSESATRIRRFPRTVVLQNTESLTAVDSVFGSAEAALNVLPGHPVTMITYKQRNLRTGVALPLKNSARLRVVEKLMAGDELNEQLGEEEIFND